MKMGVDAPWYNDPVENTAFNLYAMQHEELDELADKLKEYEITNWEGVKEYYNLTDYEMAYLEDRINRG